MNTNRWIDPTQPPKLQQGTQMLYFTAAFDVLNGALSGWFIFFVLAAMSWWSRLLGGKSKSDNARRVILGQG